MPARPTTVSGRRTLSLPIQPSLYEVRRPAELGSLEGRVYALIVATASHLGRPVPGTDAAASQAARQIARGLLPSGPPPSPLVEFAMRSQGLVDPPPHLVVASAPPDGERELLDQLGGRLERILRQGTYLRVGVGLEVPERLGPGEMAGASTMPSGRTDRERRLVVALFEGRVRFRPMARELRLGEGARLDFEVLSAHRPVRLIIAEPGGRILTEQPRPRDGRYASSLSCGSRGVYQVEVTGDGPFGAEVLANFPIHCGEPAPRVVHYSTAPAQAGTEEGLEREVYRLTNLLRQRQALPALRYSSAVARVARQHSQDMRDEQFVGHVSPRSGSPADRLRRAGVVHLVARENVARSYTPAEALSELQKSPAHRLNLLATDVDELGVGVVVDRSGASPVLLVTQNFIRGGTAVDAAAGPAPVYRAVADHRRRAGLPPLAREPELEKLAARYLEQALPGATDQRQADAELSAALRRFGGRFQQVEGVLIKTAVLEGLGRAKELGKRGPTHVGIGIGVAGGSGHSGQIAVFVLLATPR